MNESVPAIARWLLAFGLAHQFLVYAVIILLSFAEGPWLALVLGLLIRCSDFGVVPIYVCLMVGDLIGDAAWYMVGRHFGRRFIVRYGKYVSVTERGVELMSKRFHRHQDWVLFLSKISNGFGFATVTLLTAGVVRINFGRYMLVNALGQFIWTGLLLSIGFFFAHLYVTVHGVLARMSLAAGVIVLIALCYGAWRFLRSRAQAPGA